MMSDRAKGAFVAITERREIEFDLRAVQLALEWSPRSAQAFGLPPLTPHAVRCNAAEGTVEVTYGELTSTRVFMLRAEAVGAILIAYCNRAGMPMPRAADKAVRIERDHVVVVFTLRIAGAQPPEVPESTITRVTGSGARVVLDRNGALSALAGLRRAIQSAGTVARGAHDEPDRAADRRAHAVRR